MFNIEKKSGLLAVVVAASALSLSAQPNAQSYDSIESQSIPASDAAQTPEMIIQAWPERARSLARLMLEKYGQPSRLSAGRLVWYNNGPWLRTVVHREDWPRSMANMDENYLEQTIAYLIPDYKISALKSFDQRIVIDEAGDELSARSGSESINFLLLNLADQIVNNKRSVQDARDFYDKTQRLSESGKASPYTWRFLFDLINNSRPEYPVSF